MRCISSEARQDGSRQGSRESRGGDRGRTSSRDRVAIEVIEAVARIVDEGSLRVQLRRRSQRGVGTVVTRNHLSRDCPKPMKCRNCGQEGHVAKDCPQTFEKGEPREKEKKGKGKRQVESFGR